MNQKNRREPTHVIAPGSEGRRLTEEYNHDNGFVSAPTREKALYIQRWCQATSKCDSPSPTEIAKEFRVSRSTASRWMEPLKEFWEGTDVEPAGEREYVLQGRYLSNILGSCKLSLIRRMASSPDEASLIAVCAAQDDHTIDELKAIRDRFERTTDRDTVIAEIFYGPDR